MVEILKLKNDDLEPQKKLSLMPEEIIDFLSVIYQQKRGGYSF